MTRGMIKSEDCAGNPTLAPRIVANRTRLIEQLHLTNAHLRANLRFLERISYLKDVKETLYHVHATLRLPPWLTTSLSTTDGNVIAVLKLDIIHADASLLKQLTATKKLKTSSIRYGASTTTGKIQSRKKSVTHRREHPGSLPTFLPENNSLCNEKEDIE